MTDRRHDKLLILDLDETLVYAAPAPLDGPRADFLLENYHVYKRPHMDAFLKTCRDWFTVAVWTSASPAYADACVAALFDEWARRELSFVWASDRCTRRFDAETGVFYWRKNIAKARRATGYERGAVIAVDDTPQKWETAWGNLVRVAPFVGDLSDDELPRLLAYLDRLRAVDDVRRVEKRGWRTGGGNGGSDRSGL